MKEKRAAEIAIMQRASQGDFPRVEKRIYISFPCLCVHKKHSTTEVGIFTWR